MRGWASAKRIVKGEGVSTWEKLGTFVFGVIAAGIIMAVSGAIIGSRPVKTWWQKILFKLHSWSKGKYGVSLLKLSS